MDVSWEDGGGTTGKSTAAIYFRGGCAQCATPEDRTILHFMRTNPRGHFTIALTAAPCLGRGTNLILVVSLPYTQNTMY